MSLLSGNQGSASTPATPVAEAKKTEKKKGKAKERRQALYDAAITVDAFIKSLPGVQPTVAVAEALKLLTKVPGVRTGGGFGGTPVLNKLFGDSPQVGMKITIQDVFSKTMKGVQQMNGLIRKWSEKGIVVKYTHNEAEPFKSTYEIVSIAG
jgi:hypothetical protein